MGHVQEDKVSYGLSSESVVKEVIIRHDSTATRYKVVVEAIDLEALRQEKENLEAELAMEEPTDVELIEWAKTIHPFSFKEATRKRLEEINRILE